MTRHRARRPVSPPKPTALSPRRRRAFIAITVALPWLVLLVLEAGLRIGGYGSSYPLFVDYPPNVAYRLPNQDVAKRYFRPGTITPLPQLDFFASQKTPATIRLVFQGESSAAGFPYRHGGAPSRMLEQRLQETFPARSVEVINTALTGINSYTLLDFADEIIAQHPDAVLVYTGHNEYYGVLGVGSARSVGRWRPLILAYLALHRLRTVQLIERTMSAGASSVAGQSSEDAPRTVMELMAGDRRIPFGSPVYERGLAQFRANLDALLSRYHAAGVPVFIGTIASNERDQPPFISGFRAGADSASWRTHMRAAGDALARADSLGAVRELESAIRVDSTAADAHFALARLLDARGDTVRAHSEYRAAKDFDELRFRAPEAINRIIREVAARDGATVVETERALEQASGRGTVGRTVMLEHLHPNVDGYFTIADAFYEALRAKAMFAPWTSAVTTARARAEIPVTPLDSAIGALRTDRLRSGWPFQPSGRTVTPIVDTLHPRNPVELLAQAVIQGSLTWTDAMERLRASDESNGDVDGAMQVVRVMAQEYRYSAAPYMDAARITLAKHRDAEALRYVQAANARAESPNGVRLLGLLLLRRGDSAAAMQQLRRAAQLAPGDARIAATTTAAERIPTLERARAQMPRDTTVLIALATAYGMTLQFEKARAVADDVLAIAPSHARAKQLLQQLPP